MPSKRYRSRTSLGGQINKIKNSVSQADNTSVPSVVGNASVGASSVIRDTITSETIAYSSIDSTTFSQSAFIPNGETNQRVPAPLNETLYWTKVSEGLVELHRSGVHGSGELEDIQNVSATNQGLLLDATNGTSRIYLTGRLPIPKSRKLFATWESDLPINVQLVYWITTPTYFVESAFITNGIYHFDLNTSSHTVAVGDTIKVLETSSTFNGLFSVVSVTGDTVRAVAKSDSHSLTISDFVYTANNTTAVLTVSNVNVSAVQIVAGDLLVLGNSISALEGYHRITDVDDTTTANTIVMKFTDANYDTDVTSPSVYANTNVSVYKDVLNDYVSQQNYSPYGRLSVDTYKYVELRDRQVWGADGYTSAIQEVSITNNVAYVKTIQAHYMTVGDSVKILGVDSILGYTNAFDTESSVVLSVDAPNNSFTYSVSYANVATNTNSTSVVVSDLPGAYAITNNQYDPSEYAVYAELTTPNVSPTRTLSKAKVFEVVGEEKNRSVYANISGISANTTHFTVTLDTNVPGFTGNVSITLDDALANTYGGVYQIFSTSGSTASFALVNSGLSFQSISGYISGVVQSKHSELSPDGIIFYAADGSIESRLGSESLDSISLSNASIDVSGVATFTEVQATNKTLSGALEVDGASTFLSPISVSQDISLTPNVTGTANLIGSSDLLRYHVATSNATGAYAQTTALNYYTGDILNRFARGMVYSVAYAGLASDNTITLSSNRYALASGSFTLEANRNYLFVCSPGSLGVQTATNIAMRYQFVASNNIAMANYAYDTQASPGFTDVRQSARFGPAYVGPISPLVFSYQTTSDTTGMANGFSNTHILSQSEIFWMLRLEYATGTHTNAVIQDSGHKNSQMGVTIYDMGPAYANSVASLSNAEAWPTTGTFIAGNVAPNVITVTETVYANSTTSAYFDNYGIGDSGTSDPYANQNSIYQGNPGTASGTKRSQVAFESVTAVIPDYATKLASQNLVVTNIEVYLRNRHSYNSGGLTTYIGCSIDTNARNSTAPPTPITGAGQVTTSFTKGQGKYTTLSSTMRPYFANGNARSILISMKTASSNAYDTTLSNYGYFDGDLQSDPPKLRITYTYTTTG